MKKILIIILIIFSIVLLLAIWLKAPEKFGGTNSIEGVLIQIRIREETEQGVFNDALYFT